MIDTSVCEKSKNYTLSWSKIYLSAILFVIDVNNDPPEHIKNKEYYISSISYYVITMVIILYVTVVIEYTNFYTFILGIQCDNRIYVYQWQFRFLKSYYYLQVVWFLSSQRLQPAMNQLRIHVNFSSRRSFTAWANSALSWQLRISLALADLSFAAAGFGVLCIFIAEEITHWRPCW